MIITKTPFDFPQLDSCDEVIISDDGSKGRTISIVKKYFGNDDNASPLTHYPENNMIKRRKRC